MPQAEFPIIPKISSKMSFSNWGDGERKKKNHEIAVQRRADL